MRSACRSISTTPSCTLVTAEGVHDSRAPNRIDPLEGWIADPLSCFPGQEDE
jgi:hypothetical protein